MIKISIIEPIGGHGGNEYYLTNLLKSINNNLDYQAVLYTCDEKGSFQVNPNVKYYYKKIYGKSNKYIRFIRYLYGTILSLNSSRKNNVDIVHIHVFGLNILSYINIWLSKKIYRFKTVVTIHDVKALLTNSFQDRDMISIDSISTLIDGIVAHTDYAKNQIKDSLNSRNFLNIPISTIYACDLDYNSLDNENHNCKDKARKELNLPIKDKIILFFGQITESKGVDILLQSISKVIHSGINVKLLLAGRVKLSNAIFASYEDIIKDNKIDKYIIKHLHYINSKDVKNYFRSADIIVLPYKRNYNSGILIRAMSYGTPIIASDFGPFSEFIENRKNGILFKRNSIEDLSKCIIETINHPELLERMHYNEIEFIISNFNLEKIGKQYRKFYSKILKLERNAS